VDLLASLRGTSHLQPRTGGLADWEFVFGLALSAVDSGQKLFNAKNLLAEHAVQQLSNSVGFLVPKYLSPQKYAMKFARNQISPRTTK